VTHSSIPAGPLSGRDAWRGEDLAQTPELWRRELTAVELAELDDAAERLLAAGWPQVPSATPEAGRDAAPSAALVAAALPTLGPALAAIREELLLGRGFHVLRGLPVEDAGEPVAATPGQVSPRVAARFWALGLCLGAPVVQNGRGHLLGHVCDLGMSADDPATRLYQTNQRQGFHTDSADLVALLCLRNAPTGGDSTLISAATAYNAVLARDPELAAALFLPVPTDHRNEEPPGADPWFEIPVLSYFDDALSVIYQRRYIDSTSRFAAAPRLDDTRRAALDLFDEILEDPALHLGMRLAPGDVQLVHNHQLLHDRTAFTDDPDPARRRHLLRLWICPPTGRSLPPTFAQRYGSLEIGRRGGVVPKGPKVIALSP
jgi:Taurine catabolism dioxygenase TauD, TfdA family